MLRRMVLLVIAGFALALAALPGAAAAQDPGDPLGPLPAASPTPVPTVVVQDTSDDTDDVGQDTLLVIGGGLLLTFLVIGRVIFRDARRHVPADAHPGQLREQGPHKHKRQAKARARARTKAQREARRRNR
jgi:hypothetical protein